MTNFGRLEGPASTESADAPEAGAPPIEIDAETAAMAADLLAHWWSRPTPDEVALWRGGDDNEAFVFDRMGEPDRRLSKNLEDADVLLAQYEQLFVGPGPVPCPPYESYWRNDVSPDIRRSLMGPCTADLARIYADVGLVIAPEIGEMPDNVAIEFEALAYALVLEGGRAAARELVVEHVKRWIPQLCRAVRRSADTPFYTELANVTAQWIKSIQFHLEAIAPSDTALD